MTVHLAAKSPTVQPVIGKLMMVTVDGTRMMFPGDDIKTFGSVHDLETGDLCTNSIGWIRHAGSKIPVYCFSEQFDITPYLLENRSICVVLGDSDVAFMCSDIKTLDHPVERMLPLPECMSSSGTPVEGFCLYRVNNEIRTNMLCSSGSIKRFIDAENR